MSEPQVDWTDHLKTEPLTRPELATFFQTSSKHVGQFVESLEGTERIGRKWRVLVKHMPPAYLISAGLITPVQQTAQGLSRTLGITLPTNSTDGHRI